MDNLAFVLVPGSFSGPWIYEKVIPVLTAPPYSLPPSAIHQFGLPSATPTRPEGPATLEDDVAALRAVLEPLADSGKSIVLVLSSYGGFPGTEASYGLSIASRSKLGKPGGISVMVYLAAYMPCVGESVVSMLNHPVPQGPGGYQIMPAYTEKGGAEVFGDLDSEQERRSVWERLNNHSCISVCGKIKQEGWRENKIVYLLPTLDVVISQPLQRSYLQKVREAGADIEVIEREWGHAPMMGRQEEVAEIIARAAGLVF
jgi:hypothetical protein